MASATQPIDVRRVANALNVAPIPEGTDRGSVPWWVHELETDLEARRPLVQFYEDAYHGLNRLTFVSDRYEETFAQMLAAISDNWMPVIVEAPSERLKVQGFRIGETKGDEDAWRIFEDNHLDVDQDLLFREAGKQGESYLLTWPELTSRPGVFGRFFGRKSEYRPRITVEHPSQMIVRRSAGDRRLFLAAFKKWQDDDLVMGTLYLPDGIYYLQREARSRWVPREGVDQVAAGNPLGVVPVSAAVNNPQVLPAIPPKTALIRGIVGAVGLGRSDMADGVGTQEEIDKLVADMMISSEYGAYQQRWGIGIDVPKDPETGEAIEPFKASVDRLWTSPSDKAKFGEFSATDLQNFTRAWENRIRSLSARTRTPPHYLLGQISNASGDALKAAETGLVSKTNKKKGPFGEALEHAIRLGFGVLGDKRAMITDCEVDWANSESRSEAEHIDSLTKKLAIGVPVEQLWEDAGYTPQQIKRFRELLRKQALELAMFDIADPNANLPSPDNPPEPEPEPDAGD